MSTQQLHLDFPAFCLTFLSLRRVLLVGGGGGPSKSGLKNGIKVIKLTREGLMELQPGMLETADEAVMTLTSHDDKTDCLVVAGVNDRCWLLEVDSSQREEVKLALLRSLQADASPSDDGYIRVARFCPEGRSFWCGGSEGVGREWGVPELRLLTRLQSPDEEEVVEVLDVDQGAIIFESSKSRKTRLFLSGLKDPLPATLKYSFKFVRKLPTSQWLVIENPEKSQTKQTIAPKLTFFDGGAEGKRGKTFNLSPAQKNCTCLQVEKDFISLGFADGSILVLSLSDPSTCFLWVHSAHSFPVTGLAIDQSTGRLYSVSADGVLKSTRLWPTGRKPLNCAAFGLKVALIMLLLALIAGLILHPSLITNQPVDEQAEFDSFYSALSTAQI